MKYQVSIEIFLKSSGQIKKLLHDNHFRIYMKNGLTGELNSDDGNSDTAENPEKTNSRYYYWYCLYNSDSEFPPQEVLQEAMKHPSLKKLSINYIGD